MYDTSSFRVTIFHIEFMSLSFHISCIKIACIYYYTQRFIPNSLLGKHFFTSQLCTKINISYFKDFSLFMPVYMTEVTLNVNNYIDICPIHSKFQKSMYDRTKNIYAQNQSRRSIHCSCILKAVHNKITELFEEPSYM